MEGISGNPRFNPLGRPRLHSLILIVRGVVRGIELKVEQLVCGNQIHSEYNGCVGVYVPAGLPGKWRGLRAWRLAKVYPPAAPARGGGVGLVGLAGSKRMKAGHVEGRNRGLAVDDVRGG